MRKRILSMILVLCMLCSLLPVQAIAAATQQAREARAAATQEQLRNPFADVRESDWYYEAVQYARVNSLFSGTSADTFSPNVTMTRAMFVTVLGHLAGVDPANYAGATGFTDAPETAYYAPFVKWAAQYGITSGTGDGKFSPDAHIDRQQMATLFVNYFETFGVTYHTGTSIATTPADMDRVAPYAKQAVLKLWQAGLLSGDGTNFDPTGSATRAQVAAVCMNTDKAVDTWYKAPGVPSDRVRVDLTAEQKPPKQEDAGSSGDDSTYAVRFYDGSRLIQTIYADRDVPLGTVPSSEKTSKQNATFAGWFTDVACTTPFYAAEPVTGDMSVYAKYEDMGTPEALTVTSFAQMDETPDLSFEVVKVSGEEAPETAITLVPKDGSPILPLRLEESGGVYTVSAENGFTEGCSYELTLAEGWIFKDKPDTIRTAAFSIAQDEVQNMQLSKEITYIQDTEAISYTVDVDADGDGILDGAQTVDVLLPSLVPQNGGTFDYSAADTLRNGDVICFYKDTIPTERDYINNDRDYLNDPEVYAKVKSISGSTVTFGALSDEDMEKLYEVPDNFPLFASVYTLDADTGAYVLEELADGIPTGNTGTHTIHSLDAATYSLMMGTDAGQEPRAYAMSKLSVGDFVSIYMDPNAVLTGSEDDVYFGEITDIDMDTGEIRYRRTTADAIRTAMDLNIAPSINGDDLITPEEKAHIERTLQAQVEASGFAEEAAYMLADLATKTDGFRKDQGVQEYLLTGADGRPLTDEEIELLNLGGSFELSDDIQLTVELITSGDQLHFSDGVQLAIGIDATFEVETADEGKIAIELSATFVEEAELAIGAKGNVVYKEILGCIPVPLGARISATVDIKNYTAVAFNVVVYTVAPEEEDTWTKLKNICKDPSGLLDLPGLPEGLTNGLKTVADAMDKIEEIQAKIDQVKGTAEQLAGYARDIDALWTAIPSDVTNKEQWKELGETLGKTNITQDLMDMLGLSTETNIQSGKYAESLSDLMNKYSEMLQQETDWVELVREEMFSYEYCAYGLAFGITVDFVVRADLNIAMGTSLEYEVGKRYNFWFEFGLFVPSAGSSSMDLLDEHFAFQFYVMGKIGLRMGVAANLSVGIGSVKFLGMGVTAELGPYLKLCGFFIYEYDKLRPANTNDWQYQERMAGALYMEFGMYFILSFDASALNGLFSFSHEFFNEEYPLLTVGERRYPYAFAYELAEDEVIRVRDEDNNSNTGITMKLSDELRALSFVDLDTGLMGSEWQSYNNYNVMLSNPNFTFDKTTGKISVSVPEGVRYMECDLTFTYLHGKLAFCDYDMSITIPLVWTNLAAEELAEYFTASVRVGNVTDGYETIWSRQVKKNQPFDLPTEAEVKKMIGYDTNDLKYGSSVTYAGGTDLMITQDKSYDFDVDYQKYSVTVNGIQAADGTTSAKTYTARYGERFDMSDLAATGTNKADTTYTNGPDAMVYTNSNDTEYTKFSGVTTNKTIDVVTGRNADGTPIITAQPIDLTQPITGKMAQALKAGPNTATAHYEDDSVTVHITYSGIPHWGDTQTIRKGTEPNFAPIEDSAARMGLDVTGMSPEYGKVYSSTTFDVTCGILTGPSRTMTFEENGGTAVSDREKVVGALLGALPTPTRDGFRFVGWYADETMTSRFGARKMPDRDVTLYAKWQAEEYTVTLNVNGGNALPEEDRTRMRVYGEAYGALPTPTRSGYAFAGWFTAADSGTQVTESTTVTQTADHSIYAQWTKLIEIPRTVFVGFDVPESFTYEKGVERTAEYSFWPGTELTCVESEFTVEYLMEGGDEYVSKPISAGTYGARVTRPQLGLYEQFEEFYEGALTIEKATRTIPQPAITLKEATFTTMDLNVGALSIDDLHPDATLTYLARPKGQTGILDYEGQSAPNSTVIRDLAPGFEYTVCASVTGDPNYHDARSESTPSMFTKAMPTGSWKDHTEAFTVVDNKVTINTAGQLAMLASRVNGGENFQTVTVTLGASIDLSAYRWDPIGNTQNGMFTGLFDGAGHTIRGMVVYAPDASGQGLFADIGGWNPLFPDELAHGIRDLRLEDSYVHGASSVGGIVGMITTGLSIENCVSDVVVVATTSYAGGIAGQFTVSSTISQIKNCVNYGRVSTPMVAGGIAGGASDGLPRGAMLANCVNYGRIIATESNAGGITGSSSSGRIVNSANFGYVSGGKTIGGVIGSLFDNKTEVYNCYNVGTVMGTGENVGAIAGSKKQNDKIHQGYYLKGSASCRGEERYAVGTATGSMADGSEGTKTAYFESPVTQISKVYDGNAGTLIQVLNKWVKDNGSPYQAVEWVTENDAYPLPSGLPMWDRGR